MATLENRGSRESKDLLYSLHSKEQTCILLARGLRLNIQIYFAIQNVIQERRGGNVDMEREKKRNMKKNRSKIGKATIGSILE